MAKIMQALLVLAVMSPLLASAKLVILGDSLSDNGVDGILAGTELVNNKFSTGPVSFLRAGTFALSVGTTSRQIEVYASGGDCVTRQRFMNDILVL